MVRRFCATGEQEAFKGAVHGAACVLAAAMAAYNIAAWCFRRERHLGINAVVYTLATAWEVKQTLHHFVEDEPVPAAWPAPLPFVRSIDDDIAA